MSLRSPLAVPASLIVAAAAAAAVLVVTPPLSRAAAPDPSGPLRVTGQVDAVTVFSDRALVRRTLPFAPTRPTGTLRFHSLPVALLADSVRASARGATITSVAVRPTVPASEREWRDHPLKMDVDRIEQLLQTERDQLTTFSEQLRLLGSLGSMTTAQSDRELRQGSIRTDGWKAAVEFLEERRAGYQRKMRQANQALQRLTHERAEAALKLNEAMVARRRSPVEVEVGYVARPGTSALVTLEYAVSSVSWTPLYDLRGSAEGGPFQLVASANIRQTSGEAWDNVKVTLSTARPAVGTAPGTLEPWRLSQRSLAPPVGNNRNRLNLGNEAVTDGAQGQASSATASTTMTVELPGRERIASDNADHRVVLRTSQLPARLTHVAIPSLTPQVFLRARLQNSSGIPLLRGAVALFLDGNFVGTSTFGHQAASGEELDIYLGPDQRLQVKRTLLRGDVEGSGFFSKKVTVKNQWQIEIANFSGRTRQVVVLDQYPVSADPSIESAFAGSSRTPDRKDPSGLLRWTCEVAHGRRERFDFSYALTVPRPMWDRLEQQNQLQERRKTVQFDDATSYASPASPSSPAPARARQQRRIYNLEQMIQKR